MFSYYSFSETTGAICIILGVLIWIVLTVAFNRLSPISLWGRLVMTVVVAPILATVGATMLLFVIKIVGYTLWVATGGTKF
jgi:multisubunit Na+/H+ antiporter MnhG subunit